MQALRRLDIFPKFDSRFEQEAREKTAFGAVLSVASIVVALLLAVGELRYFMSVETRHELYVDTTPVDKRMSIAINVTFHHAPCDLVGIDAIDSFGEFLEDIGKHTKITRVNRDGSPIGEAEPIVNSGKKGDHTEHIDATGKKVKCMSCYGAERFPGACCNTCEEVQQAYEMRQWTFDVQDVAIVQCAKERLEAAARRLSHEGCNIAAELHVKRVQGNIHFIPGKSFKHMGMHLHDMSSKELKDLNLTHTIHTLGFGRQYPGLVQPLDGQTRASTLPESLAEKEKKHDSHEGPRGGGRGANQLQMMLGGFGGPDETIGHAFGGGKFQYFVKVVPTRWQPLGAGEAGTLETNQYSVTEHYAPVKTDPNFIPGIFILYDLNPIMVHMYEASPYDSVAHFLLELCAIVGGVFTVAGLVDAALHHGAKQVRRKMQIGKQS
jgi:hypothetical protein